MPRPPSVRGTLAVEIPLYVTAPVELGITPLLGLSFKL